MGAEEKKKEKMNHIVRAAARVFSGKGYNRTVMADIAVEAGIGKGTVYEYFRSKEELFFAVFEWFVHEVATAEVGISALTMPASQRLKALSESLMRTLDQNREMYALVMEFWAATVSLPLRDRLKDAFREAYREFRVLVGSLIREGMAQGEFRSDADVESVASALVATWDALPLQAWFDKDIDPSSTARKFMEVVVRGLLAETKPDGSIAGNRKEEEPG